MATYKVLQDIEAEDKFIGALTLKQFIFCSIAVISAYISFFALTKGLWFVPIILLPIILIFGFLAFPWGRDQPTEIWLLAKLHYLFQPRKRVWDQTGTQELVHITAPPKMVEYSGDNLSQTEVKSRLRALADTIDTRGWAVKNASGPGDEFASVAQSPDRLIEPESILPKAVQADFSSVKDIFDDSKMANLDSKLNQSTSQHRDDVIEKVKDITQNPGADDKNIPWFLNETPKSNDDYSTFITKPLEQPDNGPLLSDQFRADTPMDIDEELTAKELEHKRNQQKEVFHNHKSLDPNGSTSKNSRDSDVTPTTRPDTMRLARSDSMSVQSIQNEASQKGFQDADDGEVIVPLH